MSEPAISGVAYPLQVLRLWLIIALATATNWGCLVSFVRSPAILNATDSGSVKGAGLWESTVRPGSMVFAICLCIAFRLLRVYIDNVLRWFLLMGGQTDKHRLNLSIDSELWRACSEISRQTGMNWSAVAAEAFALYVRYFSPRERLFDVDLGIETEQMMPLSEAIKYFEGGGIFRATTARASSTDIPTLLLADGMPYEETPAYVFEYLDHEPCAFEANFYRSCDS